LYNNILKMIPSDGIPYSMEPMETGLPLLGVRKMSNGQFNNSSIFGFGHG
jgi:hypothetical protein